MDCNLIYFSVSLVFILTCFRPCNLQGQVSIHFCRDSHDRMPKQRTQTLFQIVFPRLMGRKISGTSYQVLITNSKAIFVFQGALWSGKMH